MVLMKLVDVSCPHCGANMKDTDNARTVHCDYCNHDFLIDDEVIQINHRFENAEQAGYEFEKGRQRYKDEEDVIQFDARCPLCGELFYEDYRAKRTVCPYCYKEVDAEIAFALSKAVWYENMEQPLEALAKYNQVLKSYPKCQTAIDGRERVKPKANTHNVIGCLGVSIVLLVILMFTSPSFSIPFTLVIVCCGAFAYYKNKEEDDTVQVLQQNNASSNNTVNNVSFGSKTNYASGDVGSQSGYVNFDSDLATPPIIPTPEDCQSKLLEIDCLMDKYQDNPDMISYLHERQSAWEQLLFEAQTEEDDEM